MPIYEYRCKDCGNEFEELVPLSRTDAPPCPACQSPDTEKKISLFAGMGGSSGGGGSSCGTSGFS